MASAFRSRQPAYLIYFFSTAMLGFTFIAVSCYQLFSQGIDTRWIALALIAGIVATFTLKLPGINSKISVADTFILINMIFFGPAAGCISAALEAFSGSVRSSTRKRRMEFTMFNMGNAAICAYLSGLAYFRVLGSGPLDHSPATTLAGLFPSAIVLALCYYLLNSATVAIVVALESHKDVYRIWVENFLWHPVNYLACTFGAVLIAADGNLMTPVTLVALGLVVTTVYATYRIILEKLATARG